MAGKIDANTGNVGLDMGVDWKLIQRPEDPQFVSRLGMVNSVLLETTTLVSGWVDI